MKMAKAILAGFLALAPAVTAAAGPPRGAPGGESNRPQLPETLNSLYPPAQSLPVYLLKMVNLEASFSGIVADLMEGDIEGAQGSFEEFRRHYREAGDMVPEWKREYPMQEVGKLGAALDAKDRSLAMDAVAEVGGICHRCHVATMVPVQQKYRWGNMRAMTVRDPLSGAATGYARFKASMAANLAGITVDLKQGQPANARKQYDAFRARFQALSESCQGCHETQSRHYVDGDMQDVLDKIGTSLSGGPPDADTVTSLVQKIGIESCSKCHLVHVPAALAATTRW